MESGSYFRIADIGVRPNMADVHFSTSGPVKSLAAIAEAKPLTVMSRIDLTPEMVSGHRQWRRRGAFPAEARHRL